MRLLFKPMLKLEGYTYLFTYLLTYLLTYSLYGAESFLRS